VKVIRQLSGRSIVILPELSERELQWLIVSTNVSTVGANGRFSCFFPPWPDKIDLPPYETVAAAEAERAIRSFGTNALPYLQAGLHCRESWITSLFFHWVWPRIPLRVQKVIRNPMHPVHMRAKSAYALGLLGTNAWSAAPELEELAQKETDDIVRSVAYEALNRINPKGSGDLYPELFQRSRPLGRPGDTQNTNASNSFSTKLSL
jgi:hypothetical protein